jgi:hypothetical protein
MRLHRPTFILATCLSALLILFPSSVSIVFSQSARVVAIGDIHGDFDAFVGILEKARLIDPQKRWTGGNAILVQTGDFVDRGPKPRAVMDLLMALQKDAPRQRGRVVVLMGNHEAMNIYGDLRYVSNPDYASFIDDGPAAAKETTDSARPRGFAERCAAFARDGRYGKWVRSLPAIARVNDSVFLHGGISPELSAASIEKINDAVAAEIKAFDAYKDFMIDKKLAQPCSTLEELMTSARTAFDKAKGKDAETLKSLMSYPGWISVHEDGPLWFRGYAQWTDMEGGPRIEALAKTFGVARFVVGHTPQTGGQIVSRFEDKVYLIDTGMLSGYVPGGRASALNIQDGKISFIY